MTARRKKELEAKRQLLALCWSKFADQGHKLRCQIDDGLDTRPITVGHAEAYEELCSWLADVIKDIGKEIGDG